MAVGEKIKEFIRDARWVISISERPSEREFKMAAKFIAFLAFAAGVLQFIFYVANVYMMEYLNKAAVQTYQFTPAQEAAAVLSSLLVIFAGLIYIAIKLG
ncbi:MAG: Sec translocase subunit gamma [Thermoproteus sp.]|nr:Sec translocase subunit gamma [Thermoproteus sp.]